MLDVVESLNFLKVNGLPVVQGIVVESEAALRASFDMLGSSLVLKIVSGGHKIDVGGVLVGASFNEALKFLKKFKRVLVQPVVNGLELILGVKKDSVFGHVLMVGLGGTLVEFYRDVSFRACPLKRSDAFNMLRELKASKVLDGYRGQPGVDERVLASLMVKLSKLAVKEDVKELDINPLICDGKQLSIVDARLRI